MGLFRSAATLVPLTTNALAFAVLYGNQLLTGQYLQAVLGMSALEAGAWTIPSACAYALGGLVSGRLVARWGPSAVLAGGLALSATGFGVQAFVGASDGAVVYLVGSVVAALGLAPVYLVSTESTVAAMPTERAGVAGATLETLTNVGGALGVAVFGSLLNAVYLTRTSGLAVQTRSIGDAAVAASGLDGPAAAAVLTTARLAFVAGFRLVAAIGAALLLVAFVAVVVTGSTHPTSRPGPRDDVENATS